MSVYKRQYGSGTYLNMLTGFASGYVNGRVMCSDGKVRRLHRIAETADTFFSVPASVQVWHDGKRVTVAGYVTIETLQGFTTDTPEDPPVAKFVAYQYRKNCAALPAGTYIVK